eukprot:m.486569 g.486569  ORF g.486569 m.486569 type:complete len:883 (+) comp24499_c0_seq1:219-2867(+)
MAANMNAVLQACFNHDKTQRQAAEQFLEQFKSQNLPGCMAALVAELQNQANDPIIRMQAGVQLKNCITSKDDAVADQKAKMWASIDAPTREHIKTSTLATLGTENMSPSQAAGVVAAIAAIELPHNLWPNVMEHLLGPAATPTAPEGQRTACLEAIGYICEAVSPEFLEAQSNNILTGVVQCLRAEEQNTKVKLAAVTALFNALEFCHNNFQRDGERHLIMQVVCECTQVPDVAIQAKALECLVRIMSLYYSLMGQYMAPALFPITLKAMESGTPEVVLQGIEFWSNVCDEEIELEIQLEECAPNPPPMASQHYMQGALSHVLPVVVKLLAQQTEHDDEDEWTVSKAAAVCVSCIAQLTKNSVFEFVMPFVQGNIANPNWQFRDAALMAFGSLFEGPDPEQLTQIAAGAMGHLIGMITDPSVQVKDTLAWVLGRVCSVIPGTVLNDTHLQPLVQALLQGLQMDPRVASNTCWAIYSLAESAYEHGASLHPAADTPPTYLLSPYFNTLVGALFATSARPDADQSHLRSTSYEALMALLQNFAEDCYPSVQQAAGEIFKRIQGCLGIAVEGRAREDLLMHAETQSLLCASLQCLIRNMHKEDIISAADTIMQILLAMFQQSTKIAASNVVEDALMAVSALVEELDADFIRYIDAVKPFVVLALQNTQEYQVCLVAAGVVGDIARALGKATLPYCQEFMHFLCADLLAPNLHKSVKPQILGSIGDIALAIGADFKLFLDNALPGVNTASTYAATTPEADDYDLIEYLSDLRENCLEAYTGILQAFKGDGPEPSQDVWLLKDSVPHILGFMNAIVRDPQVTESCIRASLGLFGDICESFRGQVPQALATVPPDFWEALLYQGSMCKDKKTKMLLKYAKKSFKKVVN